MAIKRKLTKIERFGLICIAVIAAFYSYLKMVYDPTSQSFEDMRNQYAELTEEVAAFEATSSAKGLKNKIAELKETQSVLSEELDGYLARGKMQTQRDVTQALVDINRLSLHYSLSAVEILRREMNASDAGGKAGKNQSDDASADALDPIVLGSGWQRYAMTLNGNYSNLTGFIQDLKTLDAYVYIQYVQIAYDVPTDENEERLYQMFIVLLI